MTGTQRSLHSNDGETCAATLERTVLLPCAGQQIASETLPDLVRPGGTCGDPADCDGRTLRSCMPITELLSVLPILYGNRESGHSYKVKLAMTLLGYPHEYRAVDIDLPLERRPADFRAVSLFGEVPVLVEGARRIVQSNAILLHLARQTGRLGGELDPALLEQWLFWEANRIGISIPNLRHVMRWQPHTSDDVKTWLRSRALHDLTRLDRELDGKRFILGNAVTVVDVACCSYLFWIDQAGLTLESWPHVQAWLEHIRALPGWAAPYDLLE